MAKLTLFLILVVIPLVSAATWVWSDGSSLSYSNWASGQPDNSGGVEECTRLFPGTWGNGATWNDIPCSPSSGWKWPYVCTLSSSYCTSSCLTSSPKTCVTTSDGKCYKYFSTLKIWVDGEAACKSLGGHLASVPNSVDSDKLGILNKDNTNDGVLIGLKQSTSSTGGGGGTTGSFGSSVDVQSLLVGIGLQAIYIMIAIWRRNGIVLALNTVNSNKSNLSVFTTEIRNIIERPSFRPSLGKLKSFTNWALWLFVLGGIVSVVTSLEPSVAFLGYIISGLNGLMTLYTMFAKPDERKVMKEIRSKINSSDLKIEGKMSSAVEATEMVGVSTSVSMSRKSINTNAIDPLPVSSASASTSVSTSTKFSPSAKEAECQEVITKGGR